MRPPRRLLIQADGLRRCLCPRLNDVALSRSLLTSPRNLSSAAAAAIVTPPVDPPPVYAAPPRAPTHSRPTPVPPTALPPLEQISRLASRRSPAVFSTASLLVASGALAPSLRLYEILIGACVVGGHGVSLQATAFSLLDDMCARGIVPNANVYTMLLRLLARSTDYVRRARVLELMQQRWFEVGEQAWGWVVLGYLKDCQVEIALEMVVEREERGWEVGRWVYKALVKRLVELGEVQEALRVLRRIEGEFGGLVWQGVMRPEGRSRMWWELLVKGAKDMNIEVTRYVWYKALVHEAPLPMFTPSLGDCNLVLNCAARHSDASLAADVLRVLTEEGLPLSEHHYASLLEATASNSPTKCFSILSHMRSIGLPPTAFTAQPLVLHLSQTKSATDAASTSLLDLGGTADLAAVESVLAAYCALGELDAAFDVYTTIAQLTSAMPTTHTFNILLAGCAAAGEKALALYTLAEMRGMQVPPDQESYDAMVRVCVNACEPDAEGVERPWDDDVWTWLEAMKLKRWRLRRKSYELLAIGCAKRGDERAVKVVEELARVHPVGKVDALRAEVGRKLVWVKGREGREGR